MFKNQQMDQIVLEKMMHVLNLAQIVKNDIGLQNVISTDSLPYSEPGRRSDSNKMPFFVFSTGTSFLTKLEK